MLTDIKVGLTCNNACRHCIMVPVRRREDAAGNAVDASFAQICAAIDAAASRGDEGITLTGGEVTVRDDLYGLVHHAIERKLTVTIQTNGRRLKKSVNAAFLDGIGDRSRVSFVVALHGSEATVHDAVTRRPGSFEETIVGIQHVLGLGFQIWGKVVLSRLNVGDAVATLRILTSLGVRSVTIAFPHAEDFDEASFNEVVPRYGDLRALFDELASSPREALRLEHLDLETMPFCILSHAVLWSSSMDIDFAMARLSGSDTSIRMAFDDSVIDWSATRPTIKTKSKACSSCLMERLCEGPWAEYAAHFGVDEFRPITDRLLVERFLAAL